MQFMRERNHYLWFHNSARTHVMSVHERKKPYKCLICDYSCFEKGTLKKHIHNVHEEKTQYKCPTCDFTSSYKNSLKANITTIHAGLKPHNKCPIHEGEKPCKCSVCDYNCLKKGSLKRPINMHGKQISQVHYLWLCYSM